MTAAEQARELNRMIADIYRQEGAPVPLPVLPTWQIESLCLKRPELRGLIAERSRLEEIARLENTFGG